MAGVCRTDGTIEVKQIGLGHSRCSGVSEDNAEQDAETGQQRTVSGP